MSESMGPSDTPRAKDQLSFGEERFCVLEALAPESPAYAVLSALRFKGPLDVDRLRAALSGVIARHEILRAHYPDVDGRPVRRIAAVDPAGVPLEIESIDASGDVDARIRRRTAAILERRLDLAQGPLVRAVLLRVAPDDHTLVLLIHHIVLDDWSKQLIYRDLAELYAADAEGRAPDLPPVPIGYGEYAVRQREAQSQPAALEALAWWKNELAGLPTTLGIPTDRARRHTLRRAGHAAIRLSDADTAAMQALCASESTSMFIGGLAAFALVLGRHARRQDVVVGTPFADRGRSDVEELAGYFLNTLPIRLALPEHTTFREALRLCRTRSLEVFSRREVPYERIVRETNPGRQPGADPLFQAMFAYLGTTTPPSFPGLETTCVPADPTYAKFDLTLFLGIEDGRLQGDLEFARDLFDQGTADALARTFTALLSACVATPDQPLDTVPLLSPPEEREHVARAAGARAPGPEQRDLCQRFREVVDAHGDVPALIHEGRPMAYAELASRAEHLARHLESEGVVPGDLVAVTGERSLAYVVSVLAILRAGAAYLPLDPESPRQRLAHIVERADVSLVIGDAQTLSAVSGRRGIPIERASERPPETLRLGAAPSSASTTAYVMFTSGSTGEPKGVVVPHRAVSALVHEQDYVPMGPGARFLLLAPPSFDASTLELWAPLLSGATLVVGPQDVPSLAELEIVLRDGRVSVLWLGAAFFNEVVDHHPQMLKGVGHVIVGGEALSVDHMRRAMAALPETRLVNGYGPTENTTFSTTYALTEVPEPDQTSIPIGRPIANALAIVLDEGLRPVPIGAPGELHVGGAGLADGYLADPELTARRFCTPDDGPLAGVRLYRTGDVCRERPDGNLEFLGRADRQLKVRGHRVEPGEIEAAMREHPSVDRAVVSLQPTRAGPRLVGFFEPVPGAALGPADVRACLTSRLPRTMIPSKLVGLEHLPITANGKVDLAALPVPDTAEDPDVAESARSGPENWLASIWADALGCASIPRDASFFDLGGDSLLLMRVVARIERETGRSIPLTALIAAPTLEAASKAIGVDGPRARDIHLNERRSGTPVFGAPGLPRHSMIFGHVAGHLSAPFIGLQLPGRDEQGQEPLGSIEAMAEHCLESAVSHAPEGPYRLCGYSLGGLIAWEMAAQLEARGATVSHVFLFDAVSPTCPTRGRVARQVARLRKFVAWPPERRAAFLRGRLGRPFRRKANDVSSPSASESRSGWLHRDFTHQLARAYRPPTIDADVVLFRPRVRVDYLEIQGIPDDAGWGRHTRGVLRVEPLESTHRDLLRASEIERVVCTMAPLLAAPVPQ